ncbi:MULTISPECIES: type II toxin-antitoxin system RelE/ParE family toxin [unclassified Flavobacterium]|jgi:plasmid stabilization system protein ParE|uniref:type II toxin-antitoxin system RelE/ParE family toxin n=1 Tax=unclassified Flavobacterium TaxID=196869 RepID=UPI0025BBC61D|nr:MULTISPECIES: type II toxin-antitoxin system RelE/ParE family toxin [unclassified Flavobacterium]
MALEIKWTLQADKGLAFVIEYLEAEWTFREILQLEENITQVTNQISLFPDLYPKSKTYTNLHKALVDKNNYLIYRVNYKKSSIEIINFRGTKQKPKY